MADFRGDTMYFIVVDRFFDGDPTNNTGKDRDFDPTHTNWWVYWGGDLRGVLRKLDYLGGMGVSAIWFTPLFDQFDGVVSVGGERMAPYHGYWAKDFKRIDEHLVDDPSEVRVFARDDTVFDEVVTAMHGRGMKIVLDIVCNHSNPYAGGGRGELFDDGTLIASYDQNHGGWYRKAGGVENYSDLTEIQSRDFAGLADFDEESTAYRAYIKEAMRGWLDKGVDAFRVDTVKHMPLWFWQEFTGDMHVHRPDLFMFGEWYLGGCWDPASVDFANKSGMPILDFAWRNAVVSALAHRSQRGFFEIADVVNHDHLFEDATSLVTFVDNHDLPRFLSLSPDPHRFRLAVLLTMVARGIPCLYYGGEQLLHCDTNRGNDPYNRPMMSSFEVTPLYRDIAALAALRRRSPAVQKGGMRTKLLTADCYAFTRSWLGSHLLVAVNRSEQVVELPVTGLELPDGTLEDVLAGPPVTIQDGAARLTVPSRSLVVYSVLAPLPSGPVVLDLQVNGIRTQFGEELFVCGDAPELGGWDVQRAVPMEYVDAATWGTTVAFDRSRGREIHYKFLVRKGGGFVREPGRGHRRPVPAEQPARGLIWRDQWQT